MEKYQGKKYKLEIEQDEFAESPREWQDGSEMICFHSRYTLGDKHYFNSQEDFFSNLASRFVTPIEIVYYEYETYRIIEDNLDEDRFNIEESNFDEWKDSELLEVIENNLTILPLYLYDHSGITMSTSPFSCRWDSGQVGWIYSDYLSENELKREVELYDNFLTGEVYQFILYKKKYFRVSKVETDEYGNDIGIREEEVETEWELIDSCTGFYGDDLRQNGLYDCLDKDVCYDLGILK